MNTKIVYTVVSGENDIFLPQAMVATYTARKHNPSANIILMVDQSTEPFVHNRLSSVKNYVDDIVVVKVPEELNKTQRSRYLKTTLRNNIKGDYLYIDTDTVVTGDLSDIDNMSTHMAAVFDRHSKIDEHAYKKKIESDISIVGLQIKDLHNCYFNSGVMFVKDCSITHKLYDLWYKYWDEARRNSQNIDQPALAKANRNCGFPIEELSGVWNCQLSDNFLNYLTDAKILHYFSSMNQSPFLLFDMNIFNKILNSGSVPPEIILILEKPKEFFIRRHLIIYGKDVLFYHTCLHSIFTHHKAIFNIFEYFAKILVTKKNW